MSVIVVFLRPLGLRLERRNSAIANEDSDTWSVLTLSKTDDHIAILVVQGSVFFGVAGKGGQEVDARDAEKVFGKDFKTLKSAVQKEMTDLWKAGVVKIEGGDVQDIVEKVALGTLEKKGRDWELTTQDCKGTDLDASGLK